MFIFWPMYFYKLKILPLHPTILGGCPGPGDAVMVRADMWEMVLTHAGPINGAPRIPAMVLMRQERTISRWKPVPFFKHLSGLLRIKLKNRKYIQYTVYLKNVLNDILYKITFKFKYFVQKVYI